ncbi:MAG: hypothetical protein WA647_19045 [Candidatus Acidiferrum sp.]
MSALDKPVRTGLSPKRLAARNRSAMAKQQLRGFDGADTNFLLSCSGSTLASYELARLAAAADLRSQLQETLDRLIDTMSQAAVARWFRDIDREALKRAIENPLDVLDWANAKSRDGQRSEEELVPVPALAPGAAHLAASLRYAERNIAAGLCSVCPKPLAHNSVRYCEVHLAAARNRHTPKDETPGTRDYLYQDRTPESKHGRQPGALASLAMAREKATRKVLAELGIPPETAAITLTAAKDALMAHMPAAKESAMQASVLFDIAAIPSIQTGKLALRELFAAGMIQRFGKGRCTSPYRYFAPAKREGLTVFGMSVDRQVG